MNGFWNPITKQGFNITEIQFGYMFSDAKYLPLNFGTTIASIYPLAAVAFGCESKLRCTTEELFEKQFINGTVSNIRPGILMPSSFLGTRYPSKCASEVWKDWGTD